MNETRDGRRRTRAGFSLVEMEIATLLIAIFLTLGLGALNVQQENLGASTTQKNLDAIRDAFVNYVRTNKRLPCPDTEPAALLAPDGRENLTGASCTSAFGVVPYLDLGLTRETALDGWGNLYSYHVSIAGGRNWSAAGPFISTGNAGGLTVQDRNAVSPFAPYSLSTAAVAVVISHGRNGLGAYTTKGTRLTLPDATTNPDENENTNGTTNTTYVRRTRTDSESATGGAFDDYVMYVTAEDLLGPLVKDGSITWADVKVSGDFERVKNAVIGYAMATPNTNGTLYYGGTNCTTPDTGTTPPYCRLLPVDLSAVGLSGLVDPLGAAYTFSLSASLWTAGSGNGIGSANSITCSSGGVAFTLTPTGSLSPKQMYCSELRAALGTKIP